MNATATRLLAALGAVIVLATVNLFIYGKERTIAHGEPIYLELAPVDPRSLMQGDYMALRFQLAQEIEHAREQGLLAPAARTAPLAIDARRIATLASSNDTDAQIRFKIHNGAVWLGTNAYFFEEGAARRFESARYGEFRLERNSGEAVLVGLRDEQLNEL